MLWCESIINSNGDTLCSYGSCCTEVVLAATAKSPSAAVKPAKGLRDNQLSEETLSLCSIAYQMNTGQPCCGLAPFGVNTRTLNAPPARSKSCVLPTSLNGDPPPMPGPSR